MKRGRLRLIQKVDSLIAANPNMLDTNWASLRRQMVRHAFVDVSEGYLERGDYGNALRFSLPNHVGFSWQAATLSLRALRGFIRGWTARVG
jgi:hypothetical protein